MEQEAIDNDVPVEQALTATQIETLSEYRRSEPNMVPVPEEAAAADAALPVVPEVAAFAPDQELREKIAMQDLREPAKFAQLLSHILSTLSVASVESQLGKLVTAGLLTNKNLWETKDPWSTAKKALEKLRDPVWLARYWPSLCFLRGKALGNTRAEAQIAMSIAVIETVGEMIGA